MDRGPLIPCRINGIRFIFSPDTGSELNIWGRQHFDNYVKLKGTKPDLKPVTHRVRAANGLPLFFAGYFVANLASESTSCRDKIYVLKENFPDPPLLSEKTLLRLGYIKYCERGSFAYINSAKVINSPAPDTAVPVSTDETDKDAALDSDGDDISDELFQAKIKAINKKFSKVFQGVGCFKNFKAELQLKPGSTPFIIKGSQCPIHLREKAKQRIQYFVEQDILEPLENGYPIQYCSPLLVIPKPKRDEVRLVANFIELNKRLYRTRHVPSPGIEEFSRVVRNHKYFFSLDIRDAYGQIALSEKSKG